MTFYKNIPFSLFILTAILLHSCSGTPLITVNPSDSDTVSNKTIHVMAVSHPIPNSDGSFPNYTVTDGKSFTNNLGYQITLTGATLSLKKLKLISDGDDTSCEAGFDVELTLDKAISLIGEDLLTSSLASHSISDRSYCQFEITLAPMTSESQHTLTRQAHDHDSDSHDHTPSTSASDNTTSEDNDKALRLQGLWSLNGGHEHSFDIAITTSIAISHTFKAKENGVTTQHPFHFHTGESEASVLIGTKYDEIFNDLDFENNDSSTLEQTVISNLATAVHQHLGDHHSN